MEGAPRATGGAREELRDGRDRWSAKRKLAAVIRLLRGEDLETLSRERQVLRLNSTSGSHCPSSTNPVRPLICTLLSSTPKKAMRTSFRSLLIGWLGTSQNVQSRLATRIQAACAEAKSRFGRNDACSHTGRNPPRIKAFRSILRLANALPPQYLRIVLVPRRRR